MNKSKILIVEDERIIAEAIKLDIQNFNCEACGIVDSGEEALKKAAEYKPDLVLIDIKLKSNMDGIETANQIKKQYGIDSILMSGYVDAEQLQRIKTSCALTYIQKPYEDITLRINIEMTLYKIEMEKTL